MSINNFSVFLVELTEKVNLSHYQKSKQTKRKNRSKAKKKILMLATHMSQQHGCCVELHLEITGAQPCLLK